MKETELEIKIKGKSVKLEFIDVKSRNFVWNWITLQARQMLKDQPYD